MSSYQESRGGRTSSTVFALLQYFLKEYLARPIFSHEIAYADKLYAAHFGSDKLFNREGWQHILWDHNGFLPLRIKAVPEGTVVPTHNVLFTVENTCPKCYWVTNYFETLLSQVWGASTVATYSRDIKKIIAHYLALTSEDYSNLQFGLHDFGFRGVTCPEAAAVLGAGHLINFLGTDTPPALVLIAENYGEFCAGHSIPASEHSTISSWGRSGEKAAYENFINVYPEGPAACVSDTWNIFNAAGQLWGTELREMVMNRKGKLVIRPDSGYPPEIVLRLLDILGERFGYSINNKGHKVLHPSVSIIQGDGVNLEMVTNVLRTAHEYGWASSNIVFGSGGALLQKHDRDEHKFAIKCSAIQQSDGNWHEVYKDPVTDAGKRSKAGRLKLVIRHGEFTTVSEHDAGEDYLKLVFENGKLHNVQSFTEIRERAAL